MSRKININPILILILLFLPACQASRIPSTVPEGFVPHLREIKERVTGSWIDIIIRSGDNPVTKYKYSGELIAVHTDSIFVLTLNKLFAFNIKSVEKARLYLFISPVNIYGLGTELVFLPNLIGIIATDYGVGFLSLGIPWLITGTVSSIIEEANNKNILEFPSKSRLDDFRKFARFPMGIPFDVNRDQLHLKVGQ